MPVSRQLTVHFALKKLQTKYKNIDYFLLKNLVLETRKEVIYIMEVPCKKPDELKIVKSTSKLLQT